MRHGYITSGASKAGVPQVTISPISVFLLVSVDVVLGIHALAFLCAEKKR